MIVPLKEMGRENHRMMSNLPQQPPIASASKARFIVSWWEREVHIWVLRKSAADLQESANEANEGLNLNQNRKLLKTIVVKGDSNISSATINQEGTLLFVSTATDVKAFQLHHHDPVKASDVKLTTMNLPAKLSQLGASHVKLSPNGRWLCVIQEGSRVFMACVDSCHVESSSAAPSVKLQRLSRLRRHIPRYVLNGGLGTYDRNITQVAFSADSQMVAVADLAGYIDTWILHGHEQALQNGGGHAATMADDAADGASDGDSSSSSEEEDNTNADSPDVWVRNPNAKLLPKLPTSPVVLSFSDHVPAAGTSVKAGGPDDYILAAVTASWNILAFHPRNGALTPWSRRHPRNALPGPVQDLLDLPKGALWQGSRIWLYGVSFLLMLDMGQNLPMSVVEAEGTDAQLTHGVKRKRMGLATGAGGRTSQGNLIPHQIRKHGVNDEWEDIAIVDRSQVDESDSDDDMPDKVDELSKQRALTNGNDTTMPTTETAADEPKKWWMTYKYRPILGIVPFATTTSQDVEVAVVERPTWDVAMAERYFAGEEWER
ncbi:hypothetical protein E4U54_000073 [Claviceps lovelessii]|nr:hypothetical protein E4U54_000073 [Claviceps lovelessii]